MLLALIVIYNIGKQYFFNSLNELALTCSCSSYCHNSIYVSMLNTNYNVISIVSIST